MEAWQRGPVEGVPPLLQPVAHVLMQAAEEAETLMENFSPQLLWEKPAGMASPAFHLQHIPGVIDRLFTYARKESLNEDQLRYLKSEGVVNAGVTIPLLLGHLKLTVGQALEILKQTDEKILTEFRGVGKKQLPSTTMGLMFHAAEHTMRHIGQLLVTVAVLKEKVQR